MSDLSTPLPDPHAIRARLSEAIGLIEQALNRGKSSSPWVSGQGPDLSFVTDGGSGGELRVILGRARAGKTALAATLVSRLIKEEENGRGVAWFSLQESGARCALRLLCLATRMPLARVMAGDVFTRRDLHHLSQAAATLAKQPVFIDDASPQSVRALRSRFQDWEEDLNPRLILIDSIEALTDNNGNRWGSSLKASEDIAGALRRLANELDVLVVCFASTSVEPAAASEPPSLKGLPESLSPLVAEAGTVLFLQTRPHHPGDCVAAAALHVRKQTDDWAPAITPLLFRPNLLRFETVE
jgi:replicative DNA helicase